MTAEPERYSFIDRAAGFGGAALMPLLPIELVGTNSVEGFGLLDTGAAVSVLPYRIGEELGADWDRQTMPISLVGNLAHLEARLIFLSAKVGRFPVVELAFAWAKTDAVPIVLGQVNFFLEFDVCFHRSRSFFEIQPSQDISLTNPD